MAQHLILGSSHALFMAQGLGHFEADWTQASSGALTIEDTGCADTWKLLFLTPKTQFLVFRQGPNGIEPLANEVLLREVAPFNVPESQVVCLIGGNEHNARFMMAQPRPFDVVHPRGPALQGGRQVVPRAVIRQLLQEGMATTQLTLRVLAGLFPLAQRRVVAPPPPIASEAQIRSHPEIFDFNRHGVEDAGVRLKVYEIMLDLLQAMATQAGYTYLPPPPQNRDAQGFLAEPYWNIATHAQPAYYAPVWAQLGAPRHASV